MGTGVSMLSKLFAPLWRRVEVDEDNSIFGAATEEIRQLRGSAVTQRCLNYGMIDETVYFTNGEVLGGVPLQVGDTVNGIAVRDGAQGGWRALRVEKNAETWEDGEGACLESESKQLRPLIGTVTSCDRDGGFINQTTYFPRHSLCEGFEPLKGDWVHAQYYISPTQWNSQAHSVAPLRYRRLDRVRVSSVFGSSGVVEDSVFFSLDSLLLPAHFRPSPGDIVSLVVVESSQSFYCWRALCMAPCENSINAARPLPEAELKNILKDKGDMLVTAKTHFGALLLGQSRELVVCIQNKGSENHRLKCCKFAGWDSEEQFTLDSVNDPPISRHHNSPGLADQVDCELDGDLDLVENSEVHQALVHRPAVRAKEKELDIAPGMKVSVRVVCRAKNIGSCAELLLLNFSSFTIGRLIEVTVVSKEESLLQPYTPYSPYMVPETPLQQVQVVTVSAPPPTHRRFYPKRPSMRSQGQSTWTNTRDISQSFITH